MLIVPTTIQTDKMDVEIKPLLKPLQDVQLYSTVHY